ncbi:hypothetical protein LguiA_019307 [Lonicera macranthoides]
MATANPFDLLGDDDNDDPSQLLAAQQQKIAPKKAAAAQPAKSAKLPSKPPPPAQAVREAKNEGPRGGGRGVGRGYGRGRGGGGFNRDTANKESSFGGSGFSSGQGAIEESDSGRTFERRGGYDGPRGPFRGGRRGVGSGNGEAEDGERPRRVFERRSGTGRGNEFKREGAGRGNWGSQSEEFTQVTEEVINEGEKLLDVEKPSREKDTTEGNEENPANEPEEKEPEVTEMTLEEYEKVLEEKRKTLLALKTEERKVKIDKELASMQQLSNKKSDDEIFVKLGSEKDKRKEIAEKEEKAKKSLSINEFLKPAEGERPHFSYRGRGRGSRGRFSEPRSAPNYASIHAPAIADPGEFPTLGAK